MGRGLSVVRVNWQKSRVRHQAAIWAVPAAYIVAAVFLGIAIPRLDVQLFNASIFSEQTATYLLSAIASGMLTFTGVVFSMTFLLLQFSSSAYSPRLARFLLQDRIVRHSLGMFIATFIYTLIALIVVGLPGAAKAYDLTEFVALLGVLGSVIWFLSLLQHVTTLQVSNVLYKIGDRAREVIQKMYPVQYVPVNGTPASAPETMLRRNRNQILSRLPPASQTIYYTGRPLTILYIDIPRLVSLAARADALIKLNYWVGDLVSDGAVLMEVCGGKEQLDEQALSQAVELSETRTIEQDPRYAIRLIVDIGVRALSGAINDPTTAVQAIDQLDDLLHRLGNRVLEIGYAYDRYGGLRVLYPAPDWEDYLDLALHEIRFYGATSLQVMRRMRALLQDLYLVLPEDRRPLVKQHLDRVAASVERTFQDYADRADAHQADRQGIGLSRRPNR